ncbi:ENV1 protein, partial [Turnix velox]|nr:ENV1 protein [Turnix velox]
NEILWNNNTAKQLPPGIYLICGDRAWQGIPKNAYRGPCYLGQLTMLTISRQQWGNIMLNAKRQKRALHAFTPDCKDNLELWNPAVNFLASIIPSVGTAQALNQLSKLACWSAKQANVTANILTAMAQDISSLCRALLQNRAAIDFLLLAQGHGCEDFEGMCCFNLSDHSRSIQQQLQWLRKHVNNLQVMDNTWFGSLFGFLAPWLKTLLQEILRIIVILVLVVLALKVV